LGILSRRVALNLCGIYSILKRIVRTSISGGAIPATRPRKRGFLKVRNFGRATEGGGQS
jgi:hypothetical protein